MDTWIWHFNMTLPSSIHFIGHYTVEVQNQYYSPVVGLMKQTIQRLYKEWNSLSKVVLCCPLYYSPSFTMSSCSDLLLWWHWQTGWQFWWEDRGHPHQAWHAQGLHRLCCLHGRGLDYSLDFGYIVRAEWSGWWLVGLCQHVCCRHFHSILSIPWPPCFFFGG